MLAWTKSVGTGFVQKPGFVYLQRDVGRTESYSPKFFLHERTIDLPHFMPMCFSWAANTTWRN